MGEVEEGVEFGSRENTSFMKEEWKKGLGDDARMINGEEG